MQQTRNLLVPLLLIVYTTQTLAEVVLDGTLGSAIELDGPDFDIAAELGQQHGGNLFHSFKWFNLDKEETATFSGPNTVENIIGRVTGGKSFVDGKLRSKIPQADLYLINPDGFIFGPNATLDLQGSLHISTASQLRLGETGRFETRHPQRSLLVSAPPSAFGFLDSKPASIEIRGSKLATQDGQTLSMLGGQLDINGGRLTAVSGRINLAAVLEANQLKSTSSGLVVDANAQLGKIALKNNASVNVGKLGAGDIYIRGGQFFLDNSRIIANTEVDKDSGMIVIDVNELRLENEAHINSRALGPGQGGQIIINVAGAATLSGESQISSSSSFSTSAGDAGNIFFEADNISLFNSTISTTTSGPGQGGDIIIKAHQDINLIGAADFSTAIAASSEPKKDPANAGNAGRIFIRARNLNLSGATSQIDNSTRGAGQGGSITLEIADRLRLSDGALISADSFGLGHAGSIYVNATTLEMDKGTISTAAETASGGNIIVNVRTWLNMKNSLLSATVTSGIGNGGNLAISNPRFLNLTASKVIANASGGHGGLILIITDTPIESYESSITASSETGLAGEVKIDNIYNVDVSILPIDFMDASVLIKQRCAARTDTESSNFFVVGRGGLPNAPDDLQIYLPPP
ncbi:MAG TPA: filamentous hemagglutinin N-terminal domain-containing protein [Thioploca sp.]|nr:MAG: hypothetical protein B6247_01290 [Beggiatoa sp. 4572_84]RKZ62618.1 MAG: hypothetical protein DRR08_05520 [Gammaproteobacteria bacterium]HDN25968.1 filamentous hemagglutinin N-terminal domain-containing protein [Thioploca sp.]